MLAPAEWLVGSEMAGGWRNWLSNWQRIWRRCSRPVLSDEVSLDFPGVRVTVSRRSDDPTPHELHVILPRVEIRRECTRTTPAVCRTEIVLSSITIVEAPRRTLAGPTATAATPSPPPSSERRPDGENATGDERGGGFHKRRLLRGQRCQRS